MRLVLVIWRDAGGRSGWRDIDETIEWASDDSNFLVTTVGFVGAESEDALLLFPSISGNKVLDPIIIPQRMIEHIEDVDLGDENGSE